MTSRSARSLPLPRPRSRFLALAGPGPSIAQASSREFRVIPARDGMVARGGRKKMKRVSRSDAAVATAIAAMLVWAGCGSSSNDGFAPATPSGSGGGGSSGSSSGSGGSFGGPDAAPPEVKSEGNYQSPVATGKVRLDREPDERARRVHRRDVARRQDRRGRRRPHLPRRRARPDRRRRHRPQRDCRTTRRSCATTCGRSTSKTFPVTADANSWAVSSTGAGRSPGPTRRAIATPIRRRASRTSPCSI